MIVNRIKLNKFPDLKICGKTCAEIQNIHFKTHDVLSEKKAVPSDGVICLIYDDTPLLTKKYLLFLKRQCLSCGVAFSIGKGYIKPVSYKGLFIKPKYKETKIFSPSEISYFTREITKEILVKHAKGGVIVINDNAVTIDYDTKICPGATIRPFVTLENSYVGENTVIGEGSFLSNAHIGNDCVILNSRLENTVLGNSVTFGPFSYARMNTTVGNGCRVGDFVELKNSILSDGVKSAHLTYIGDASVGEKTNVGCGTVFCNFDGKTKHRSLVGDNVFIGANTNLVAPITIGNNVFIAAGGTITENIPDNSFVIGRSKQNVKKNTK